MKNRIQQIKITYNNALLAVKTLEELEQIRITFLGRNGSVTALLHEIKNFSDEEKRLYGSLLNDFKVYCHYHYKETEKNLQQRVSQQKSLHQRNFDVTASKSVSLHGSLHPYTQIIEQLEDIFISMGYMVVDGPEVESDYYNFEALNIAADHPARDMQDTLWLDVPGMLLRTHTSPAQIHVMQNNKPPLAIFSPGRVYRNEATDASHDFMFLQGELLFIDVDISISHLLATGHTFLRTFFGNQDLKLRVRPGYFPFVEPGLEMDISCPFCQKGCSVCKKTGWIELLGSGLIHPNVLRAGGIDPDVYSGFAFGFGISRLAMLKHAIDDIRLLISTNLEFINQF